MGSVSILSIRCDIGYAKSVVNTLLAMLVDGVYIHSHSHVSIILS